MKTQHFISAFMVVITYFLETTRAVPAINLRTRDSDPKADANMIQNPPEKDAQFDRFMIPPNLVSLSDVAHDDLPGEPINPNDFEKGAQLDGVQHDLTHLIMSEEMEDPILLCSISEAGRCFQGDIILSSADVIFNLSANTVSGNPLFDAEQPRNAIIDLNKRWVNGVIPYSISASYDSMERATIAKGMSAFHTHTCIRFTPVNGEKDYVHIAKSNGCSSAVGRVGGRQVVSLGVGCVYYGIVIHELMHASGFWHEQSRQDRDSFITIVWTNIQDGMEYNFQKYDWNIIQNLGVNYDTGSVMHYGANSFAKNRAKPTIIARNGERIGQRDNFSTKDIEKLNLLYTCSENGGSGTGSGGGSGIIQPQTTTSAPITPRPTSECKNHNQHCKYWKGIGECEKNPSWMNDNCKKACGQCGICQDNNEWCAAWKDRGECKKSATYMHKNCRKSCGLCHGAVPAVTALKCEDQNEYCTAWTKSGECRINPDYMYQHCKKSCTKGKC